MITDLATLGGKVSPLIIKAREQASEGQTSIDVLKDAHAFIREASKSGMRGYTQAELRRLADKIQNLPAGREAKVHVERLKYLSENVCIHVFDGRRHCSHCGEIFEGDTSWVAVEEWKQHIERLSHKLQYEKTQKLERQAILRGKAQEAFTSLRELGIFGEKIDGMERSLDISQPNIEEFDLKLEWLRPFRELARC